MTKEDINKKILNGFIIERLYNFFGNPLREHTTLDIVVNYHKPDSTIMEIGSWSQINLEDLANHITSEL